MIEQFSLFFQPAGPFKNIKNQTPVIKGDNLYHEISLKLKKPSDLTAQKAFY